MAPLRRRTISESGVSLRKILFFTFLLGITVPAFITFTLTFRKGHVLKDSKENSKNNEVNSKKKKLERARLALSKKMAMEDAVKSLRLLLETSNLTKKDNKAKSFEEMIGYVSRKQYNDANSPPLIIAITPTYTRAWQAAHLNQVVNVLRLIPPPLLWIVVESENKTEETRLLLERTAGKSMGPSISCHPSKINYIHISTRIMHGPTFISRGVEQRNMALELIERERLEGIVYFMDDDNIYTLELFEEIRRVRRIGVLPVGFLWSAEAGIVRPRKQTYPFVERPLVRHFRRRSHVFGWETFQWAFGKYSRKFHVDMAGMAFRSNLLWEKPSALTGRPHHPVRFHPKSGYLETQFINRLIDNELELEPLANDCQNVLVWHTHTEAKISDPYPLNWHLPQPAHLVRDKNPTSKSPYWIKRMRYAVRGHTKRIPFGYKPGVNSSKADPVSPNEVDKALNFGLTLDSFASDQTNSERGKKENLGLGLRVSIRSQNSLSSNRVDEKEADKDAESAPDLLDASADNVETVENSKEANELENAGLSEVQDFKTSMFSFLNPRSKVYSKIGRFQNHLDGNVVVNQSGSDLTKVSSSDSQSLESYDANSGKKKE